MFLLPPPLGWFHQQRIFHRTPQKSHTAVSAFQRGACARQERARRGVELKPFSARAPPYRSPVASCLTLDLRVDKAR